MGYLTPGEIFENMLPLKRFGLYFEKNLNSKWLLSYRNNDISYRYAKGFRVQMVLCSQRTRPVLCTHRPSLLPIGPCA